MMKAYFAYLTGTPFENGAASGRHYKEGLQSIAPRFAEKMNNPVYAAATKRILELTEGALPVYVEECRGRAAGAGLDFEVFWAMMCTELNRLSSGCTSMVAKRADGSAVIAHNEDEEDLPGFLSIAKIKTDYGWWCTSDIYNMPFGNGYSWNSHGILKTINYTHEPVPDPTCIPRYFAQRHISEASSLEDFKKRCLEFKWGSGFHAFVVDAKTGEAMSVEGSIDGMNFVMVDRFAVHTNHYLYGHYKDNICTSGNGNHTVFRRLFAMDKLRNLIDSGADPDVGSLRDILNFRDPQGRDEYSLFLPYKESGNVTIGGIGFDTRCPDKIDLLFQPLGERYCANWDLSDILG